MKRPDRFRKKLLRSNIDSLFSLSLRLCVYLSTTYLRALVLTEGGFLFKIFVSCYSFRQLFLKMFRLLLGGVFFEYAFYRWVCDVHQVVELPRNTISCIVFSIMLCWRHLCTYRARSVVSILHESARRAKRTKRKRTQREKEKPVKVTQLAISDETRSATPETSSDFSFSFFSLSLCLLFFLLPSFSSSLFTLRSSSSSSPRELPRNRLSERHIQIKSSALYRYSVPADDTAHGQSPGQKHFCQGYRCACLRLFFFLPT